MKLKINFVLMILLFIVIKSYSQVTVKIENVLVNNQTNVINCNTIDFGTVSNSYLNFSFKLSKSSGFTPNGTLKIMLKYSSSINGSERSSQIFQSTSWSTDGTTSIGNISCNIASSEIQVSGSTIYLEYTANGSTYQSCVHPLIKTPTPTFLLVPTYVELLCSSISSKTFTVNNVYSSQGTLSYSWNVGTGWKQNGAPVSGTFTTTTNSITLEPTSGTTLPSNVSVTTTLNGVQYGTQTSPITRKAIIQTITAIQGVSTLCSGSTNYNFGTENVLTGQTVIWSLSNSTVATLSNNSNTGVTLNLIGNGSVTLTATIQDGCGQSYSKTKDLYGGAPPVISVTRGTAQSEYCDSKYHYVPFTISKPLGTSLSFPFLYPNASYSAVLSSNDEYTYTFAFLKGYSGYFNMYAVLTNSCGSSSYETEGDFYIQSCSELQLNNNANKLNLETIFKVYPNPSDDVVYLELVDDNNVPEKKAEILASLYDMFGLEKAKVTVKDNKAVIDVSKLPTGLYILIITINGETETHLISRK